MANSPRKNQLDPFHDDDYATDDNGDDDQNDDAGAISAPC